MKKLLLLLGLLVAGAVVAMMIRSRATGGDAIPEMWSDTAKDVQSKVSDSVKGAASAVKDKAAEATNTIKEKAEHAGEALKGATKDAVS